jgi:Cobalamin biosynthesis protein CobT (nicotinate-mononucleotide:5, 6-dimethylbenzimidazole phosphoribosyltransferase)
MNLIELSKMIGYEPYTQEFDRISHIEELLSEEVIAEIHGLMTNYRSSDTPQMVAFSEAVPVMSEKIAKSFEETGVDPAQTTVTLLIDNSGSTRGEPAINMALGTIELCHALERLGVQTSVLGYTTTSWKGGASREKWVKDGRPENPGRLCDLLHIVYKHPEETVYSTIDLLCSIASDKTKKENVDGEAIMWAAECLRSLERPNKILINVTDGFTPIDDSTLYTNKDGNLLLSHLFTVNRELEDEGVIALAGVYVDLNSTHQESMTKLAELGQHIFARSVSSKQPRDASSTLQAMTEGVELGLKRARELSPAQPTAARR